jgi:hypothetical protein
MNGILKYYPYNIPKIGEEVIIRVKGVGFPTGFWYGVLTATAEDLGVSYCEPHDAMTEKQVFCTAHFCDMGAPPDLMGKEPYGVYEVYPYTSGMDEFIKKDRGQKAEIKALKKKILDVKALLK